MSNADIPIEDLTLTQKPSFNLQRKFPLQSTTDCRTITSTFTQFWIAVRIRRQSTIGSRTKSRDNNALDRSRLGRRVGF